jgi:hypothetical protein
MFDCVRLLKQTLLNLKKRKNKEKRRIPMEYHIFFFFNSIINCSTIIIPFHRTFTRGELLPNNSLFFLHTQTMLNFSIQSKANHRSWNLKKTINKYFLMSCPLNLQPGWHSKDLLNHFIDGFIETFFGILTMYNPIIWRNNSKLWSS